MISTITKNGLTTSLMILVLSLSLFLSGCADMGIGTSQDEMAPPAQTQETQPYYSSEFSDLLIPSELQWNRDKSLVIRTDSFAGGVLHFSGRVEVNSLSDFFANSMNKNGWKLVGTAKYKNVLLAFVKENKTCTITIGESEFGMKTDVAVYITEDIAGMKPAF
jgi:PBP1b-binding outer membrane lipoprotein LpoB